MLGSGGRTDPCLLRDLDTYPAHEPSDQQGRHPRAGPTHPTPTGHPKPQVRESRAQPPKLCQVDVVIHSSQTSIVMRNWCRPALSSALAILDALSRILTAVYRYCGCAQNLNSVSASVPQIWLNGTTTCHVVTLTLILTRSIRTARTSTKAAELIL